MHIASADNNNNNKKPESKAESVRARVSALVEWVDGWV
jgi:hypothetical protein